jgi:hypothetical protein
MKYRHTWCLTQRVRWNDEKFPDRDEDESLLATCNISYLARKLSASRKFDIATFFYYSALPDNHDKAEWNIVKKYNASRCLPPSIDALVPRYLVVFVDVLGSRKSTFSVPPSWGCLERAVTTTLHASGPSADCSYIISCVRESTFNAVVLVGTLITALKATAIDVTQSDATKLKSDTAPRFSKMIEVFRSISGSCDCPSICILEVDCKQYGENSETCKNTLPAGWKIVILSQFSYSTWLCVRGDVQAKLLIDFQTLYFPEDWITRYKSLSGHKQVVATMIRMCISSTLTPVPVTIHDVLLALPLVRN